MEANASSSAVRYLYGKIREKMGFEPTPCQDGFFRKAAEFMCGDEGDILVANGYAGTGKTTAVAALVNVLSQHNTPCIMLAPTGRAAKVLSSFTGRSASTIHKHIYRQSSTDDEGIGEFSIAPNKIHDALFVVDEVSLIGIDSPLNGGAMFGSGNLLDDLINFVRAGHGNKLLMMGDIAQLPPVGMDCSPALSEEYMSGYGGVSFVELTTVVRQAGESGILSNATRLRALLAEIGLDGSIPVEQLGLAEHADVQRINGGELIDALSDAYSRYGEDETVVLCRSNKRANRYNAGIRAQVKYCEEQLVRGDRLMIVKNCYQFVKNVKEMDYIANGDMAVLGRIRNHEERYGLMFADAELTFPDYDDCTLNVKVCLDTLLSESASLGQEQQNALYLGVAEDYAHLSTKKLRRLAVPEDPYYNALQLKYANAVTCHKSQGGQWSCVFIDNAFWQDELTADDLRWLYTAITRAVEKVYLVNFKDEYFI